MLQDTQDPSLRLGEAEASAHDQRRSQILDAARACFATSGFHGASMHQICAEAKMSPGALYRYFPSKEAIIEAIAEDERSKAGAVLAGFRTDAPLLDRIVTCGVAYLTAMQRPHSGRLMVEICSESLRNSSIGERFHCTEEDARREILSALEAAQQAGEIPASVDCPMALLMLFAMTDGLVLRMGLEPGLSPDAVAPHLRRIAGAVLGLGVPPLD